MKLIFFEAPIFTLYDKDEAADLTAEEKRALKQSIRAELEARSRQR